LARLLVKNARVLVRRAGESSSDLPDGALIAQDHEIVWVGPSSEVPAIGTFDRVLDASGCLVLPGLVNTHHHLYQTLTRNLATADGLGLFEWLNLLYPIWAGLTPRSGFCQRPAGVGRVGVVGSHHRSRPSLLVSQRNSP